MVNKMKLDVEERTLMKHMALPSEIRRFSWLDCVKPQLRRHAIDALKETLHSISSSVTHDDVTREVHLVQCQHVLQERCDQYRLTFFASTMKYSLTS